jgi:hypothetical protein
MNELKFDLSAMIHPKNDRDISAMLAEALAELRSINHHLEKLVEAPVEQAA